MQQVNLYTEAFRPKKIILSLSHILLITLGAIILVIAMTVLLNASLAKSDMRIVKEQGRVEALSGQLRILEEKAKLLRQDDSLVAANKRLNDKLEARRQMIDVLDSVVVKDDEGFSSILLSLARQKTDGLWLTGIQVGASGKNMTIEGKTLNANAVPAYLQNLRQENGFIGRTFTLFNLDVDPDNKSSLNFSLRSQASQSNKVQILEDESAISSSEGKEMADKMQQRVKMTRELLP